MFEGRRKSSVNWTNNQPFSTVFIFFYFLLLNRTFSRHHHSHHRTSHYNLHHIQTLNNLIWWLHHLSLSLSPLRSSFHLHHRDPNSSSNHPYQQQQRQRFSPHLLLPQATPAPTATSTTPAVQLFTVATISTTSSFSVKPPSRQVTFLSLSLSLSFFFFTLFTAWTVGVNYNSRPVVHLNSGRKL